MATFDVSDQTYVNIGNGIYDIDSVVFTPEAALFDLSIYDGDLTLSGIGIVNNSGLLQTVSVQAIDFPDSGGYPDVFYFTASATAGDLIQITTINGDNGAFGGVLDFKDNSTAGRAAIYNLGSPEVYAGETVFYGSSSAAKATITNEPGKFYAGGQSEFYDTSNAGNAMIINNAASVTDGAGGVLDFHDSSSAANSTIVCYGNPAGSYSPAGVEFFGDSDGANARIMVFGDGQLAIGLHNHPGVRIGSLEGDGNVVLTYFSAYLPNTLTVGRNDRSTRFDGVIQEGPFQTGGSLRKVGRGTLTLTGANKYAGGTVIRSGVLRINSQSGSGTGTGPVKVTGGSLGGKGTIEGTVVIGARGTVAPSLGLKKLVTLTIQSDLTFRPGSTYAYRFDSMHSKGDGLVAAGITINSNAQLSINDTGSAVLPIGTVFTAISNTAANPIAGSFRNLADGGTITDGGNTFLADYEGGDGNDLALTVVQ